MPSPLATHKFIIVWPNILAERVMVIAEATTYPQIKMGSVSIPCYGDHIKVPSGVPESDHTWKVRVSEDFLGSVKECILKFNTTVKDMVQFSTPQTVTVMIPNQLDVPLAGFQLYDCWLAGRDSVNLDQSNPTNVFKWNLEFHFSSVKDFSPLGSNFKL